MNAVFDFNDYKQYLNSVVEQKGAVRGITSRMAEAASCQPSFLSRVLSGPVQLTPDQACGIAQFLNLSDIETDYFLNLVDFSRCGTAPLKARLKNRLETLKAMGAGITQRLAARTTEINETNNFFFSSWKWAALQILASIPDYQTVDAIAVRLGLKPSEVQRDLEKLEASGLLFRESGKWKHSGVSVYIGKNDPYVNFHHQNWRQQGTLSAQRNDPGSVHFTGVYAISKNDYEKVRVMIANFIETAHKVILPSSEEELICLMCDLFRVGNF